MAGPGRSLPRARCNGGLTRAASRIRARRAEQARLYKPCCCRAGLARLRPAGGPPPCLAAAQTRLLGWWPWTARRVVQSQLGRRALGCRDDPVRASRTRRPALAARPGGGVRAGAGLRRLGPVAGAGRAWRRAQRGAAGRAAGAHRQPGTTGGHAVALGPDQPRRQPGPAERAGRARRGNRRPARRRRLLRALRRRHRAAPRAGGARAAPAAADRTGLAFHRHPDPEPQPRRGQRLAGCRSRSKAPAMAACNA